MSTGVQARGGTSPTGSIGTRGVRASANFDRRTGVSSTTLGRSDNFNRADSATSLGTPSDGGSAWVAGRGTWGISSNTGYDATPAGSDFAVLEASTPNVDVSCTFSTISTDSGLALRYVDADNSQVLLVRSGATSLQLFKLVAGVFTSLGSQGGLGLTSGTVIRVTVTSGNVFTVFVNGAQQLQITDATNATGTKHGLFTNTVSDARFENYTITPL